MNHELDYLLGLKDSTLIRLQDLLRCNASVKQIAEVKESYDLINYHINLVKQKYNITKYTNTSFPIDTEDTMYSSFVAYKGPQTTEISYSVPDHDFLVPPMNSNNITSFMKKTKIKDSVSDSVSVPIVKQELPYVLQPVVVHEQNEDYSPDYNY